MRYIHLMHEAKLSLITCMHTGFRCLFLCVLFKGITGTSRRIQLPSFVITMPPIGSRSILSMERGPSVVRIIPATALAAAMLPSWADRPDSRFVLVFCLGELGDTIC